MSGSFLNFSNKYARETLSTFLAGHCDCDSAGFVSVGKSQEPQTRPLEVEVIQVEQKDVPIWNEWGRHVEWVRQCPDQAAGNRPSTSPDLSRRISYEKWPVAA